MTYNEQVLGGNLASRRHIALPKGDDHGDIHCTDEPHGSGDAQTNGMVERFNGRINELVQQTRFASAAELETTLEHYLKIYNHHISQQALHQQTPVQTLKKWQAEKPELFVKRVYKQAGLDI